MAAPFFDPMQWLRTPSPVATPAFNPQSDILDQLRRQQEEEEEKRLNAEKMLADLIERSRNKEEEKRIERLRSEMPQDIYERLHKSYYGDPQSKAGKVGSAILQIGSGMFGTAPDINKASMEQWKTQQAAANAADTIQQREQAAAAGAISRMQQSQSRMAETEAKNKTSVVNQLIKADIEDSKRQMDRLKLMSQQGLIDAKTAAINFKTELDQKLMRFTALGKTPVEIQMMAAEANPDMFGKDAAEKIARYFSARKQEEQARPSVPGGKSEATAPVLGPGGEILGYKTSVTQRSDKPGIPGRGALIQAATGQTPEQFLTQPQQPQMPPQPAGQPAPVPQPQAAQRQAPQMPQMPQMAPAMPPQPQQQSPQPRKLGVPSAKNFRMDNYIEPRDGSESLAIYGVPRGQFIGEVRQEKLTPAQQAERNTTSNFVDNARAMRTLVQDNYITGQLDKNFGGLRSVAGKPGSDFFQWLYKNFGDDATAGLEAKFGQLNVRQLADYLKAQSGAQVSEKEYDRLVEVFEKKTATPREMAMLTFMNSVYFPARINLFKTNVLNPSTSAQMGDALQRLASEKANEYFTILEDLKNKRNVNTPSGKAYREAKLKELRDLADPQKFTEEALRRAYPDMVGKTLIVPDSDRNRDLHVYIPHQNKDMDKVGRDLQRRRAEDEMRRRGLIP